METAGDNLGLLREAIARNAGMVLSLPSAGRLRHHKSRFLADAGDGFWVRSVPDERDVVEAVISGRQPAGVAFRSGDTKVIFATEIQHWMPDYTLPAGAGEAGGGRIEALLLRFPTEVRTVQRRRNFRVPVDGTTGLEAKVWTMPEHAALRDKPAAGRELLCDVRDISLGGLGLTLRPPDGNPPPLSTGERLRIQLTHGPTVALLEGQLRYVPRASNNGTFRAGVQFRALGESKEDRQAGAQLAKIVNALERDQIRRKKLGLPVPTA